MMDIQYRRADGTFVATINGMPYHVTEDDTLFEQAQIDGADAPFEPEPEPQPPAIPQQMTFAQLLIGLVAENWISEAEGEAWLTGVVPAAVSSLIASLPEGQRFAALARASRPSVVMRSDPLVAAMADMQDKSQVEMDDFFSTYSAV